jgi:hypothetical protein
VESRELTIRLAGARRAPAPAPAEEPPARTG